MIKTSRLYIRPVNKSDLSYLSLILSNPQLMHFSIGGVHTEAMVHQFIDNSQSLYRQNGLGAMCVFEQKNEQFIGLSGLNKHMIEGEELIHINYRMLPEAQGKGFAREAVEGVCQYAKTSLGLKRVFALIEEANIASKYVALKSGFIVNKAILFKNKEFIVLKKELNGAEL